MGEILAFTPSIVGAVSCEFENTAVMASIADDGGRTVGDFLKEREEALGRRLRESVAGATEFCSVESLGGRVVAGIGMMTHGKPGAKS